MKASSLPKMVVSRRFYSTINSRGFLLFIEGIMKNGGLLFYFQAPWLDFRGVPRSWS